VFYLQSGKVKLTVVSPRGKEAVIGVLERGSFFGEGCLAAQPLRMSTARRVSDDPFPIAAIMAVLSRRRHRDDHRGPETASGRRL